MKYTIVDRSRRALEFWHWREQGIGLVVTVLAFTVLGPFETSALSLAPRLAYWLICISAGWLSVLLMLMLLLRHPRLDDWPSAVRVGLAVSLASIPIWLVVIKVEWVIRGNQLGLVSMLNVLFICALIGGLMYMRISTRLGLSQPASAPALAPASVPFFKRLSFDLGRELISLSTQDHYVEVTTAKGTSLVLIRFQDALEELGAYGGVQIHRSHWVALKAMRRLKRLDGKLLVELVDGRSLPVSRTYAQSVRAVLA